MRYQEKSFTLPCASSGVSQEEWDRIFNPDFAPALSPESREIRKQIEEKGCYYSPEALAILKKELKYPSVLLPRAEGR